MSQTHKSVKDIASFFEKRTKELPSQEANDVNRDSETSEEEEPQSEEPQEQPEVPVRIIYIKAKLSIKFNDISTILQSSTCISTITLYLYRLF